MGQPGPLREGEFVSLSQPSVVTWKLKDIEVPSPLYITRDDVLVVQATSAVANELVKVTGRLLTIDHVIVPFQAQVQLAAAGASRTVNVQLAEGFLLSFTAVGLNTFQRGQTFVRAALARAGQTIAAAAVLLVSDYVTQLQPTGWPAATLRSPVEERGAITPLQPADPAAGADFTFTVPTSTRVQILAMHALFTTAVAVANRNIEMLFSGGLGTVWRVSAPVTVAASTAAHINLGQSFVASGGVVPADIVLPLPGAFLMHGGDTIQSVTTNIQAADQWSAIIFTVEQWLDAI
jgi:hypothetical protein